MGFKKMGLKMKMMLGNSTPLLLVVALGVVVSTSVSSLLQSSELVDHTHKVIQEAMNVEAAAVDMETGMRGYLLAGKDAFLDPYKAGGARFSKLVGQLKQTVNDNPAQVSRLGEVENTIKDWQANVTEPTIELRRKIGDAETMNDMAKLVGQAKGKKYFDKFRGQIATFIDREATLLTKRQAAAAKAKSDSDENMKTMADTSKWVEHTHEVINEAEAILAHAVDMETGMRGFLLAGQEEFLTPFNEGKEHFFEEVAALKKTVSDNPTQVGRLNDMEKLIAEWLNKVVNPALALRREVVAGTKTLNDVAAYVAQKKGKQYFDAFRQKVAVFVKAERDLIGARQKSAQVAHKQLSENIALLNKNSKWVEHTNKVIQEGMKIVAAAVDQETGMRGYLLAGKEEFLDPYNQGIKKLDELIADLRETVNDNPAQVKLLGDAQATIKDWHKNVTEAMISLRRKIGDAKTMDDMAHLVAQAKGKVYFDKFRQLIDEFRQTEEGLMGQRQAVAAATARDTQNMIVIGIVLTVLIALVLSWFLSSAVTKQFRRIFQGLKSFSTAELNHLQRQFQELISGLSAGSAQVASASQQIASGASQQAASLEETAAGLEEMAAMTKSNESNAGEANQLMIATRQVVERANISMDQLTKAMGGISAASSETAKIVKSIDEIAFQTNLLALNAAVEAARAGEAGMGFAVVADEVRALAMRAADAAKNTADMIDDTVSKVENGSSLVTTTSEAFAEVATSSTKVGQLVNEIASASLEQSNGIDSINHSVGEMDKVVQENASSTEELSGQAEELSTSVNVLISMVQGSNGNGRISGGKAITHLKKPKKLIPHKANSATREISPKEVIPFEDDELGDF